MIVYKYKGWVLELYDDGSGYSTYRENYEWPDSWPEISKHFTAVRELLRKKD